MNSVQINNGNECMKKLHELRMQEAERIKKEGLTIEEYLKEASKMAEAFFEKKQVRV
ncbi:MAG: hypothetical protein HZA78_01900 [Candidatus Schekmanbacteria bacterium]|nr:hypothetical protein [Candidatus Schekmanbacteria bacterium]